MRPRSSLFCSRHSSNRTPCSDLFAAIARTIALCAARSPRSLWRTSSHISVRFALIAAASDGVASPVMPQSNRSKTSTDACRARASANAMMPCGPTPRLPLNDSAVIELVLVSAFARAMAPASPIVFSASDTSRIVKLISSICPRATAPSLPILFADRSTLCRTSLWRRAPANAAQSRSVSRHDRRRRTRSDRCPFSDDANALTNGADAVFPDRSRCRSVVVEVNARASVRMPSPENSLSPASIRVSVTLSRRHLAMSAAAWSRRRLPATFSVRTRRLARNASIRAPSRRSPISCRDRSMFSAVSIDANAVDTIDEPYPGAALVAIVVAMASLCQVGSGAECYLRPFHRHDQVFGSCPAYASLSPRNASNVMIAAGNFPCGTCLRVSNGNMQVYTVVVDQTQSPSIDLHIDPLTTLLGSSDPSLLVEGLAACCAEVVDRSQCADLYIANATATATGCNDNGPDPTGRVPPATDMGGPPANVPNGQMPRQQFRPMFQQRQQGMGTFMMRPPLPQPIHPLQQAAFRPQPAFQIPDWTAPSRSNVNVQPVDPSLQANPTAQTSDAVADANGDSTGARRRTKIRVYD